MSEETKTPEEIAFAEMAEVVRDIELKGIDVQSYIRELEAESELAARRVEVARQVAILCKSTKVRKPRKDRGTKRTPKEAQEIAKEEAKEKFAETGVDTDTHEG